MHRTDIVNTGILSTFTRRWSEAEVLEVDLARRRVFVSYVHWSRKWDEWVSMSDHRLATLHTHTYFTGGELRVGQRLEVQDPLRNVLEAYVIDEAPTQVLVHYKDFGSKYDECAPCSFSPPLPLSLSSHMRCCGVDGFLARALAYRPSGRPRAETSSGCCTSSRCPTWS